MTLKGSCACGEVSYQITDPLKLVGNCHCSICRKTHGAAYVTWGIIAPGQFRWVTGEDAVVHRESSPGRTRCFCGKCGSPLASAHEGKVGEIVVGTLDDHPGSGPGEHIFVASKAPWHEITDNLPQHPEWPPGFTP
ncbi:GFA family protein [Arenimonas donghaensis]|uniref:CENP-V/GFA domain-containing protein n=1 Tax=Arenimonas donghaensis DSM 18148 = HO3-R19 TaxID=1121014 RepID=A0A087MFP0_9GAMM|nr:GFA family protein [Arenimonas donghaensis]KFL35693.1 hypothetical protein N788_08120 [Arenimonas donghaensis DSM 18148 = HO3-R19]